MRKRSVCIWEKTIKVYGSVHGTTREGMSLLTLTTYTGELTKQAGKKTYENVVWPLRRNANYTNFSELLTTF